MVALMLCYVDGVAAVTVVAAGVAAVVVGVGVVLLMYWRVLP